MSRLTAHETGRVIATIGEEVTAERHIRSTIYLGPGKTTVYVLALSHRLDGPALEVEIDGRHAGSIHPQGSQTSLMTWYEFEVPDGFASGSKPLVLSSHGLSMSAWTIAVDYSQGGDDECSTDSGHTWSRSAIGHLHLAPGRYVVRTRVDESDDSKLPIHVWEDREHPAVKSLLQSLPASATQAESEWDAVTALSTWVCRALVYRDPDESSRYTPWNANTILDWGRQEEGRAVDLPLVMCLHFTIVLVSACQALGIPARCAPVTGSINGGDGHFVAEVWMEKWQRWVVIDPTWDVWVETSDGPADLDTIQDLGSGIGPFIHTTPATLEKLSIPAARSRFDTCVGDGSCFRYRSLWPRSDFLSRPDMTPIGHGTTAYSEMELVWELGSLDAGFGMFRWFADRDWFDARPAV